MTLSKKQAPVWPQIMAGFHPVLQAFLTQSSLIASRGLETVVIFVESEECANTINTLYYLNQISIGLRKVFDQLQNLFVLYLPIQPMIVNNTLELMD